MLNIDNTLLGLEVFDPKKHAHQFIVCAFDSLIQQIIGKSEQVIKQTKINISYWEIPHKHELIREYLVADQVDLILDFKPPQSKSFSHHFDR